MIESGAHWIIASSAWSRALSQK